MAISPRTAGTWLLLIAVPLALNALVWKLLLQPERARTQALRDAQALTEFKPKLEGLVTQADLALDDWTRGGFKGADQSQVVSALQRLAAEHRVTVQGIQASGVVASAPKTAGLAAVPVELQASGSFSKLARWISDVESHPAMQIDSLALAPDGSGHTVGTMKLTAFVRAE